ncbi:MAG: hypothetical protein RTU92_04310 [Candidatus Thorarchaeota archaeon]
MVIDESRLNDTIVDTRDHKLATWVGVVGVIIKLIRYITSVILLTLSIGTDPDTRDLLLQFFTQLYPLVFISGCLISVGFVGVFALKGKGNIGLLFVFYFFVFHYTPLFIAWFSTMDLYILYGTLSPIIVGIIYGITLLGIRDRIVHSKVYSCLVGFYLFGTAAAYLIFIAFFGFSVSNPTTFEYLLTQIPSFTFYTLTNLLLIVFFLMESRVESEEVHM